MTWLVTGASGFIGLNLLERLAELGEDVVALDQRPVPEAVAQLFPAGRLHASDGDVRDRAALARLMARQGVRRVVHAAAITPGPEREAAAPEATVSVNLTGTAAVLQAAAESGVERVVHVSSVAVFGARVPDGAVIDEDRPHDPATLYAITKSASEAIARRIARVSGLSCVTGRLGVVFGRHEQPSGVRDTMSPFWHATRHAMQGAPLVLPRPARRNWQYATDAANTLIALGLAARPDHDTYNLGPSQVWSVAEWCDMLARRFDGFRYEIADVPGAPIGLHNPSDGGVLSWHRFDAEFPNARRHRATPESAFADYLGWLEARDTPTARRSRERS